MPPMISRSTISINLQRQTPAGSRSVCAGLGPTSKVINPHRALSSIAHDEAGIKHKLDPRFRLIGRFAGRRSNKVWLKLTFRHPSSPDIDKRDAYKTKKLPNGSLLKTASESISRVLSLDDHLSRTRVTARLKHATRMHGRAAVWHSYLRLLQMGFSKPRCCQRAGALLPHRFSFSPACAGEFTFLWHFPSGRPAQPLAGILPFGARTFLTLLKAARDRLARSQCGILPYRNRNKEHHDNLRIGWRHIF